MQNDGELHDIGAKTCDVSASSSCFRQLLHSQPSSLVLFNASACAFAFGQRGVIQLRVKPL
jgi:hypothetical protein